MRIASSEKQGESVPLLQATPYRICGPSCRVAAQAIGMAGDVLRRRIHRAQGSTARQVEFKRCRQLNVYRSTRAAFCAARAGIAPYRAAPEQGKRRICAVTAANYRPMNARPHSQMPVFLDFLAIGANSRRISAVFAPEL